MVAPELQKVGHQDHHGSSPAPRCTPSLWCLLAFIMAGAHLTHQQECSMSSRH